MIHVAIAGARGRMGSEAVKAITNAHDMTLVAIYDYKYDGQHLHHGEVREDGEGIPIYTNFEKLAEDAKPDVLIDLTVPQTVYPNMEQAIEHGIRPVVGTSGLTTEEVEQLTSLAAAHEVGGIIAPNFSIGAVLMMKFSQMAARYIDDIEIIEMHHDQKVDAPSGTAVKTVDMINEVREAKKQGHPDEKESIPGARGAEVNGMHVHSVRLPGLVAHQQVLFGGEGELLTLQHDSFNRGSFMPGVLMAVREVMAQKSLIYGLENIID